MRHRGSRLGDIGERDEYQRIALFAPICRGRPRHGQDPQRRRQQCRQHQRRLHRAYRFDRAGHRLHDHPALGSARDHFAVYEPVSSVDRREVAINANFFSDVAATPSPEDLLGFAVSNGTVVAPQSFGSDDAAASLLITKTNTAAVSPAGSTPIDLSNVFNAVSGNQIVTNGVDTSSITPTGAPHDPFGLDPRTGSGFRRTENIYT